MKVTETETKQKEKLMTNYKAHKTKNQAPNLRHIINKIRDICEPSPATIEVLNVLFGYRNKYHNVYPSQTTIAEEAGISRRHVIRITNSLSDEGLIIKVNRGLETCLYYIDDRFNDLSVRRELRDLFISLRSMPFKLLLSMTICNGIVIKKDNNFISEYVTLLDPCITSSSLRTTLKTEESSIREGEPTWKVYGRECEGNQTVTNRIGVVMSELQPEYMQYIPKVLHDINNLNLAAKIKLSVFSEEVLRYSLTAMTKKNNLENPFNFLNKICTNQTQRANQEPNWPILERLPTLSEVPRFTLPFKGISGKQPNKSSWTTGHNNYQPNYKGGEPTKVKEYVPRPEWEAPKRKVETREEIDANIAKNRQSDGYPMLVRSLGQELVNKMEDNIYIKAGYVPPVRDSEVVPGVVSQTDNSLYITAGSDRLTPDSVPPTIVTKKEEPISGVDTTGERIYREVLDFMALHNIPLDKAGDDYDEVCDTGEAYSSGESSPF